MANKTAAPSGAAGCVRINNPYGINPLRTEELPYGGHA